MINMGELFAWGRIGEIEMDLVPLEGAELERAALAPGDLLFARQSLVLEGAGKCSIFLGASEPVTFESHITRLRLDGSKANPNYFYYYFQSPVGRQLIRGIVEQGAGAAGVRSSDLARLMVSVPSLDEQQRIAHLLGTLDDKIELNRRMSETLEEMARALFKSWFVDFDPVRTKAEGRDTGLPPHIADLFPDRFVDSEMGQIPAGWHVGGIGDLVRQRRDTVRPDEIADGTPYIALEHMPRHSINLSAWGDSATVTSTKARFEERSILFGKLRPYFHKVGLAQTSGICSTDIVVMEPLKSQARTWALMVVSSDDFVDFVSVRASGTRMPRTSWKDMSDFPLALPPSAVLEAFEELAGALVSRLVGTGARATQPLETARDALLRELIG